MTPRPLAAVLNTRELSAASAIRAGHTSPFTSLWNAAVAGSIGLGSASVVTSIFIVGICPLLSPVPLITGPQEESL